MTDIPLVSGSEKDRPRAASAAFTARELHGFGRASRMRAREARSEALEAITAEATLSRGLGRAYGDAALPARENDPIASTPLADRLISFDPQSGVLRAEAGTSLAQLNRVFLRRGFFTPVSPGTAQVTLGGMVAADVHGKNHHVAGTFGEHVRSLKMRLADGRILDVSDETEPDLFRATLGGMGLTGHILEVEVQMEQIPSPWIQEERHRVGSIEELVETLAIAGETWPMTMAWLDSTARGAALGRGLVWVGRWADPDRAPADPPEPLRGAIRFPIDLPSGLVNRHTLRLANLVWRAGQELRQKRGITPPETFFYPLDSIEDWPRAYGRRGFMQYQVILPADPAVYRAFLLLFQQRGGASLVTVVKDCGPAGRGLLSFPKPGLSIALDVPIARHTADTQALVDGLNAFALDYGGRIYLAKDAFTRARDFRAMYPRLDEWNAIRRKWDPEGRIRSALSRRLLDPEPAPGAQEPADR